MLKLKLQYFGHLMRRADSFEKTLMLAGKVWGQEEKEMTEDETVGWHHRLSGHGFGWTAGVGDGQGGLACYRLWGHKELDSQTQLSDWTELKWKLRHKLFETHNTSFPTGVMWYIMDIFQILTHNNCFNGSHVWTIDFLKLGIMLYIYKFTTSQTDLHMIDTPSTNKLSLNSSF